MSFQAHTVCTEALERVCGSDLVQVSAVIPKTGERGSWGREDGLKQVP